jgi:hypothetical protein
MRHPEVIVYETDGTLAAWLRGRVEANGWLLRESRHHVACLNLLREVRPSVLVAKLPSHLVEKVPDRLSATAAEALARKRERQLLEIFRLFDDAARFAPEAPTVLSAEQPLGPLVGIAYDLGVRYVSCPPAPGDWLPDAVETLMKSSIRRMLGEPAGA